MALGLCVGAGSSAKPMRRHNAAPSVLETWAPRILLVARRPSAAPNLTRHERRSVTLDDIREAAARIRPLARVTPLLAVDDGGSGARPLALKCENLQRSGAFKIRGAANMLLQLTPGGARTRRHHLLVGQPRHRHVARRVACRLPGRRRDADDGAGGEGGDRARARRGDHLRGHDDHRAQGASGGRGGRAGPHDHAAVRSPVDRRGPGDHRPRDPRAGAGRQRRSTCRPAAAACSPASPRPSRAWRRASASSAWSPRARRA